MHSEETSEALRDTAIASLGTGLGEEAALHGSADVVASGDFAEEVPAEPERNVLSLHPPRNSARKARKSTGSRGGDVKRTTPTRSEH